jgi:hypothetical protein
MGELVIAKNSHSFMKTYIFKGGYYYGKSKSEEGFRVR